MEDNVPIWDLADCYSALDCMELETDLCAAEQGFDELEDKIKQVKKAQAVNVLKLLKELNGMALAFSTTGAYVELVTMTQYVSATQASAMRRVQEIKQKQSRLWTTLMDMLLATEEAEQYVSENQDAGAYAYMLREYRRLTPHRMEPERKAIFSAMKKNGGQAWYRLRNQLDMTAAAPLEEGGPELALAQLRGLATSPDAQTRRLAYQAELQLYPTYDVPMAACLNGIKGEALEELPYKKYSSVEEEMADINKVEMKTLECMFSAIEEHIPQFRRYLRKKAEVLGHKSGLPWYDLLAPMPELPTGLTFAEAREMLADALHSFSDDLGTLAEQAMEHNWIDALPRAGKQSGAICVDLPERREVRILSNYSGSFRCVRTIAHELGHAYHARCLDDLPLLLRDAPTPICETAALMNETIFLNKTIERLPKKQKAAVLESDLQEAVHTVLDIYSRYLFEKELFSRRANAELMPKEICQLMENAQIRVYGDGLDRTCLHPYMWMCKVHYYIPEFHYYNYPYIFGLLFAKGLYAQYLKEKDVFPANYRKLLGMTCSASVEEIAMEAGADIRKKAFWDDALDMITDEIEQWMALVETTIKDAKDQV